MEALGKNSYMPYFSLSMPRGNQLARQWQLLQLIDQPAGIAVDDAARKLDCTVRTIWRDLSALQKAGFPLYDDKGADGRRSLWKLEEKITPGLPLRPRRFACLGSDSCLSDQGAPITSALRLATM